jgi:hypothetical protein
VASWAPTTTLSPSSSTRRSRKLLSGLGMAPMIFYSLLVCVFLSSQNVISFLLLGPRTLTSPLPTRRLQCRGTSSAGSSTTTRLWPFSHKSRLTWLRNRGSWIISL